MASIINAIREYIKTCPYLDKGCILGIDCLDADPIKYTIDTVPCEPIVSEYIDGSSVRQIEFTFGSREKYGQDVMQNIINSDFYENFACWIEHQNENQIFPDFGKWRNVRSIKVLTSGYAFDVTPNTARYQIQLRITYYQDRRYKKEEN